MQMQVELEVPVVLPVHATERAVLDGTAAKAREALDEPLAQHATHGLELERLVEPTGWS